MRLVKNILLTTLIGIAGLNLGCTTPHNYLRKWDLNEAMAFVEKQNNTPESCRYAALYLKSGEYGECFSDKVCYLLDEAGIKNYKIVDKQAVLCPPSEKDRDFHLLSLDKTRESKDSEILLKKLSLNKERQKIQKDYYAFLKQ